MVGFRASFAVLILIIILLTAGIAGCAQPSPSPSTPVGPTTVPSTPPSPSTSPITTPSATVSPTSAAAVTPIKLKMNSVHPASNFNNQITALYADMVRERSKGRVDIQVFSDSQLATSKNQHELVKAGSLDIGVSSPSFVVGVIPLEDIFMMPLLWNPENSLPALNGGIRNVTTKEWEQKLNTKVLAYNVTSSLYLTIARKQVTTLEDMKGLLVRGSGGALSESVAALGASVATISAAEVYTALQRKTVDGAMSTTATFLADKMWEVSKYVIDFPIVQGWQEITMNLDKFNGLPKDVQDLMLDVGKQYEPVGIERAGKFDSDAIKSLKANGMEIIVLSPQEKARWVDAEQVVLSSYVKRGGDQGKKLLDIMMTYQKK